MDSMLRELTRRNPGVRIVAAAITLQTLGRLVESFERYGIAGMDVICVNVARSKKVGGLDMMMAQNPVYLVSGGGRNTGKTPATKNLMDNPTHIASGGGDAGDGGRKR